MSETAPAAAARTETRTGSRRFVTVVTGAAAVAAAVVVWVANQTAGTAAATFSDGGLQNIAVVLSPLVLIALFIERAVEVVISSWRDHDADVLEQKLKAATDGGDAVSIQHAQLNLNRYKLDTRRLSFIVSLMLALVAGLVGVRAISPLVDAGAQGLWFRRFDIVITGLLLAGGADGIHKIVTTFTTFLDSTRKRAEAAAPDAGG